MSLRNQKVTSFLATANASASRVFFETVLDLHFIEETDFALIFSMGHSQLRIQKVRALSPSALSFFGLASRRHRQSD